MLKVMISSGRPGKLADRPGTGNGGLPCLLRMPAAKPPPMMDFATARRMMVDGQVRTMDVTDPRVIAAMFDLPRERFMSQSKSALAYLDRDVPVTDDNTRRLLKPMVLAKLVQAAEIRAGDNVLDVGCATGYSSALLARLAGSVVALEEDPQLAAQAQKNLAELDVDNGSVVRGPLTAGWRERAPYDAILLNGATEVVPKDLCDQLCDGGRLVCVLGRAPAGKATVFRYVNGDTSGRPIFDAAAPILPGFTKSQAFVF
jgi:protein-L-isoaspartate(D-aspartate) O-methyltransferase